MKDNPNHLKQRVLQAAEEALQRQQYVSPIDLFIGMKLLQPIHVVYWRNGKIPFLESMIQGSQEKITFSKKCFLEWVKEKGLKPSPTVYLAKTSGPKKELRFSESNHPETEQFFRTHYISSDLSEVNQKKLREKFEKPPELVVFSIIQNSQCSKCKKELFKRDLLFMEAENPLCLNCAHLDKLEYLPSGNTTLTRRVKKESKKSAVVVEFSRSRKRYERQGILVDKETLRKIRQELNVEEG